jgi:hypothetical protein
MNTQWWAIVFSDDSTGYMQMDNGYCIGVYRADGKLVEPEEKVEYTCVATNVEAPSWGLTNA